MTRVQANLILLLTGAIWGLGFIAQSTAMDNIGPFMFIAIRSVIAALTIAPFALKEKQHAPSRLTMADYVFFAAIGLVLFAGLCAQQIGLITTSVTNAGFLTGIYLILVPILGIILLRNWPHPVIWPSALLALAGIYLLSGGALTQLKSGDILIIFGAIFWALQVILIGQANKTGRPIMLTLVQFLTCAIAAFIFAYFTGELDFSLIPLAWKELLFTGIFSSGIAFTLQAIGQRYTSAPQAAIFMSSEALFAAFFGAIFLGERLAPVGFVGCFLIFIAMLAVEVIPILKTSKQSNRV